MSQIEIVSFNKNNLRNVFMNDIIVDMLAADEGDCFLIMAEKGNINILIDGGTAGTYHRVLKRKLQELDRQGKCIDLLVVTHIDNDHIGGILELLKENGSDLDSKIIKIRNIWHNSYRHLQLTKEREIGKAEEQILSHYITAGSAQDNLSEWKGTKKISVKQGTTLAALILAGKYHWNEQFDGKAVCSGGKNEISFGKDCRIKVLTPDQEALDKLAGLWRKELLSKWFAFKFSEDELFDDAYEYYMRYLYRSVEYYNQGISDGKNEVDMQSLADCEECSDASKTNRASISMLLQFRRRTLLFLADAHADDAFKKLDGRRKVDLIKLPHHGSSKNISKKFIDNMETEIYLISTNAERYDHPDLKTLAKIICKKTKYHKRIYFNYRLEKVTSVLEQVEESDNTTFIFLEDNQSIVLSDCTGDRDGQ